MSTTRISKIVFVLLALTIALLTVSFIARPTGIPGVNRSTNSVEQLPGQPAYIAMEKQDIREYILGERYGVTPRDYAHEQALREYWLGERYGQTP